MAEGLVMLLWDDSLWLQAHHGAGILFGLLLCRTRDRYQPAGRAVLYNPRETRTSPFALSRRLTLLTSHTCIPFAYIR